jgi:arylsulfatase A-like enzyme
MPKRNTQITRLVLALSLGALNLPPAFSVQGSVRPNVLFIIPDQWRAQAFGFAGDPNAKTPNLDHLRQQSVWFINAVAGIPVCCPSRASIMTGQRTLSHGVFLNDVPLSTNAVTMAEVLRAAGYATGYIGKWHLDGPERSHFIPPERHHGFDYWKALGCTHDYNHSLYYGDTPEAFKWNGYDAIEQTHDAQQFLRSHARADKPFLLFLAWGPPHDPYQTAPARYRDMFQPEKLELRSNVPAKVEKQSRNDLAGYYAHCAALDECVGQLMKTLEETGLDRNTIVLFTSDHGDMLGSHGMREKQKPFEESVRVPLLIRLPEMAGRESRTLDAPINSEDIMPTLLGLCGVAIPKIVEGLDLSGYIHGQKDPSDGAALLACIAPFGEWSRKYGGREFRGIRTRRYTYVRDLNGPWLLFDNKADPFQLENLIGLPRAAKQQAELEEGLQRKLRAAHDSFLPAADYIRKWNYTVDGSGTVPYSR